MQVPGEMCCFKGSVLQFNQDIVSTVASTSALCSLLGVTLRARDTTTAICEILQVIGTTCVTVDIA